MQIKKSWEEFSVHNVWHLVSSDPMLRSYLPADEMDLKRYVDREFFWGVALTVCRPWAKKYISTVIANREMQERNNLQEKKLVVVSAKWGAKLSQFDQKT